MPAERPHDALGGARSAQNLSADNPGERGDGRSLEPGRLLAAIPDPIDLSPHTLNTLDAMQEHRLHTSTQRTTPQQARNTPNPGYDPWISSSDGVLLFRIRPSETVPARGAVVRDGHAVTAGAIRQPSPSVLSGTPIPLPPVVGGHARPSAGISADSAGRASRVSGPSAFGRASIEPGHASTTAAQADERPRDNVDAEALATNLLRNTIATSVHAGPVRERGEGGVGGGGAPGSGGGQDEGGHARPFGEGEGWMSLSAPDGRYLRYFQTLRRRLDELWGDAFPREEVLRLHQGTVILAFVIHSDGSVQGVQVQRRSGFDVFDRNVVAAVSHARLPPIPRELQRDELRITVPFVFRNPIVR